ncbi:MAG: glucose-1-phosphate adenylyltransferase [Clostridiaceae bacterium]|jgi:glucose-1-phosphate adenylyltransferase|nr:glucose-1-phosphate adenylyltransferase [Clostridiaceae bacterium]
MARSEIVALILAGGQGSRLGVLTKYLAKPAVPFGSRYRIIDFALSNCANSGLETVGVLTQYQPLALNTYIGNGHPWDLDRNKGGTYILPPYQSSERSDWYKGTANAIFQNVEFIEDQDPRYVLILSGDHIYKMDYAGMLKTHIEQKADATIAVFEVPWEEASRFGIMNTDKQGRIVEFEEKPEKPRSNLASMGIYIFNWPVLRAELSCDEEDAHSDHDFGKNIIPKMLSADMRLIAYHFTGYWKDVGTIGSLWEANMDLLDRPEAINLRDRNWRIYSRNPVKPAHYIADSARVVNSAMTDGCNVSGQVEHSVLFNSVTVEKGAVVRDSILMPGVRVEAGARLNKCIVSFGTIIGKNVKAGADVEGECRYSNTRFCQDGITVFERGLKIRDGAVVPGNCMVEFLEPDTIVEAHFRV